MTDEKEKVVSTEKKAYKKFKPTFIALKNKNTVYLLTIFLFVAGIMAYQGMDRELFPEIVVPMIMVRTVHPGNSP